MTDVDESTLPGVGLRHEFAARSGRRVGVVTHHSGRRDLVIYSVDDPDAASESVELTEEEGRVLAELLGGSRISERLAALPHEVEGLVIDWLQVAEESPLSGVTIREAEVRERSGASIVAIVRPGAPVPAPGPGDRLEPGDTVVVAGTPEAVNEVSRLLEGVPEGGSTEGSRAGE